MMQVNLVKCTGCGKCLETCPVEAISIIEGKAVIDVDTCLSCQTCVDFCCEGAISEAIMLETQSMKAIQPINVPNLPVFSSRPISRHTWAGPVLSYVGREIVPRLADTLIEALDRRLSTPPEARATSGMIQYTQTIRGPRQERRRRRGKQPKST
jgi:NAD-dependent dihydropyrimidine dehydrogenase PreA subunit